jgi:hypothetical protein
VHAPSNKVKTLCFEQKVSSDLLCIYGIRNEEHSYTCIYLIYGIRNKKHSDIDSLIYGIRNKEHSDIFFIDGIQIYVHKTNLYGSGACHVFLTLKYVPSPHVFTYSKNNKNMATINTFMTSLKRIGPHTKVCYTIKNCIDMI